MNMWMRRAADNPLVVQLIHGRRAATRFSWAHELETSAENVTDGKVFCVCAALAIARYVHCSHEAQPLAESSFTLLDEWIDDPSDARFDRICGLLFDDRDPRLEGELDEITWWALRVSAAAEGCFEAGWALEALCECAEELGFDPVTIQAHGLGAVKARLT